MLEDLIARNGWKIVPDPDVIGEIAAFDEKAGNDRLPAVGHAFALQREGEEPTRLVIGPLDRKFRCLTADIRDRAGLLGGANIIGVNPDPHPPHLHWRAEYEASFCMRYARAEGEEEGAFWDRVLPKIPAPVPFMPMPQFLPGQRPEHRVVVLTGWKADEICRGVGCEAFAGTFNHLHISAMGREFRRLALHRAGTGEPLVMSVREDGYARFAARAFNASGVSAGCYTILPTADAFEAKLQW